MDKWKPLDGCNNNYEVSKDGQVRLAANHQVKVQHVDKWGYLYLSLRENKKDKYRFIHRLVALCFIPNPENKPEVNHIDGNKLNNHVSNLEWATSQENENHALDSGLITPRKPVIGIHKDTGQQRLFRSVADAARTTGESEAGISGCVNGRQKSTQNYLWGVA